MTCFFFKTHWHLSTNNTHFYLFICFFYQPSIAGRLSLGEREAATFRRMQLFSTQVLMAVSAHCPPSGWCGKSRGGGVTSAGLQKVPAWCSFPGTGTSTQRSLRPSTRRVNPMARCHGFMGMECGVLCVQGSFPSIPHCPGAC